MNFTHDSGEVFASCLTRCDCPAARQTPQLGAARLHAVLSRRFLLHFAAALSGVAWRWEFAKWSMPSFSQTYESTASAASLQAWRHSSEDSS